jgi:hypothetical protein
MATGGFWLFSEIIFVLHCDIKNGMIPKDNKKQRVCLKRTAHDQAEPEKIKWQRQSHCQT